MKALNRLHILVTRPAGQEKPLIDMLTQGGARVTHFPTIAIIDRASDACNLKKARNLRHYRLLIFISRNAVDYGLRLLRLTDTTPEQAPPVAAVGKSTADYLTHHGFDVVAYPDTPGSESLVELIEPGMQGALKNPSAGNRVLIFRGQGGKEVLAHALGARGWTVDYAEVYTRIRPADKSGDKRYDKKHEWMRDPPNLIMVTSRDSMENLVAMVPRGQRSWLMGTPVILGSENMIKPYKTSGFTMPPIVARSPLDADMFQAAVSYSASLANTPNTALLKRPATNGERAGK